MPVMLIHIVEHILHLILRRRLEAGAAQQPLQVYCNFAHLQIQQLGEALTLALEFPVHPHQRLQHGMLLIILKYAGQSADCRVFAMEADEQHLGAGLVILIMFEIGRNQGKGMRPEMIAALPDAAGAEPVNVIDQLEAFMLMPRDMGIRFMLCIYNI